MNTAYQKDIRRSIQKGYKRFLSIFVITALGVAMLTGLHAACLDMHDSADRFFDKQKLFDIRILSTLGLTEEDVEALSQVDGVEMAEGAYSETVHTDVDGICKKAEMTVLGPKGLNSPYLVAGALPARTGEIAVTQKYLDESGKSVGHSLAIKEDIEDQGKENTKDPQTAPYVEDAPDGDSNSETDIDSDMEMDLEGETETPTFPNTTYTITGVVMDPMDIRSNNSMNEFRSTAVADYTFFITGVDANNDIFTSVYITLTGTRGMNSFSDEYENTVQSVIHNIESHIKAQREQTRYNSIVMEARTKIEEAEITMNGKLAEADRQFADAWNDIAEGRQELADGEAMLTDEQKDAERQIAEARRKIENGKRELAEAEAKLAQGEKQLVQGEKELNKNAQELKKGKQQLAEERQQAEEQFAEAERQFREAQSRLDVARAQLEPGISQLKSTWGGGWPASSWNALVSTAAALAATGADDSVIAEGTAAESAALASALNDMNAALTRQISQTQAVLDIANQELAALNRQIEIAANEAMANLTAARYAKSAEAARLAAVIEQLNGQAAQLLSLPDAGVQAALGMGKMIGGQQILACQKSAFAQQKEAALRQLAAAEAELAAGETQIEAARQTLKSKKAELESGKAELADGKADLAAAEAKLNAEEAHAKQKIAEAREEIAGGKEELADGEAKLIEQEREYAGKKEEANQKLADAYAKLDDIDMTQWYVQDRSSLGSYSSLDSDLSSIEAVGKVFPVIFLLVAVLMSLTAMTRMVEEERGLIGTYKALGLGNAGIYGKYIVFAFAACLLGGIVGDILGFILIPKFVTVILEVLYSLPQYYLSFDVLYGVGGVMLFMVGIVGATALACRSELEQMPATLMRPKAPGAGARVFLERVSFIWNRLIFLNKVTARNLFRYKKRLFMTVGGIMGCTALILCGFAIKDSVADLAPKQYENIYRYDLMAVFDEDDNDNLIGQLTGDANIKDYLNLRMESVKLINTDGEAEKVQLMVIPKGGAIEDYIRLENSDGTLAHLDDDGIIITQNAEQILGLKSGAIVSLQNMELMQREAVVSGVVKNYLGNNVYMTQKLYESLFGTYAPNGVLAHLSPACTDQAAYAETLLDNDSVLSTVSISALKEDFGFDLINAVVLLITIMAGGLALVVLFTLANTNISERVGELATIKVLGFYDHEVHQYVNKEMLILTSAGILVGLPVGQVLSGFLTTALNMPSIYFAVHVEPVSYLISAAITFCFAIIVNGITNRILDRINMVEALKSVE